MNCNWLARRVTYNWKTIWFSNKTLPFWSSFIQLKTFNFLDVDTDYSVTPRQLQHWHYTWFTRNVARYIEIDWLVYWITCQDRRDQIKIVDQLFSVPTILTTDDRWYKDLSFEECDWNKWECRARVLDRPKRQDLDNCCYAQFRVRLLVWDNCIWDTCFVWSEEYSCLDKRNTIPWMDFDLDSNDIDWDTLERPFDYQRDAGCIVNYDGVSPSPLKIVITWLEDDAVPQGNLYIKVYNNGKRSTYRMQNIAMNTGNVLTIDGRYQTASLNWFDVTGNIKIPYDQFPMLQPWASQVWWWNNLVIVDSEDPHQKLKVDIYYKDYRC